MARVPYLTVEDAPEGARGLLGKLPPLHVFAALAHSPMALKGFVKMGSGLLYEGQLEGALRELVILRVAHMSGASYEVAHHEDAARQLGVAQEEIAATALGSAWEGWAPRERACLVYAEQVVEQVKAPQESWEALGAWLDEAQRVELTVTVGYYMMVARVLENLEIELEPPQTQGLTFGG